MQRLLARHAARIVVLALPLVAPALAAQAPSEVLTTGAAVALALDNHPLLRASAAELAAAEAERGIARSGYMPRLDLSLDYVRSTNPVFVFASKLGQEVFGPSDFEVARLNQPDAFSNAATRVAVRQNIWDAGRTLLGRRAADLGVKAATAGLRRTEDEVVFGALEAFWSHSLAGEMLRVARDAEAAAQAHAQLAAELVDAGIAVPSDRMSAEVRLSEVRAMRLRAEQGVEVSHSALLMALGLGEERRFRLAPPTNLTSAEDDSLSARLDSAMEDRQDLAALERRIEQAEYGVRIARSRRLPEFGAGAQYELNGNDPIDPMGSNWTVGLSMRMSLFDGSETSARVARARADGAMLAALRERMEQGVRLQVRAAWAERRSAAERLDVARSAERQAEEALRIVRERYAEGMAVMVELLAAEAANTRTQVDRAAALAELALATARLDLASGVRPDPTLTPILTSGAGE